VLLLLLLLPVMEVVVLLGQEVGLSCWTVLGGFR
jgi:hypothetical protein